MPAAMVDNATGAMRTRVSRGRTTDSDSFFHSPPTGLADGLGREDAPYSSLTARTDSPLGKWFPGSVRIRRYGYVARRLAASHDPVARDSIAEGCSAKP